MSVQNQPDKLHRIRFGPSHDGLCSFSVNFNLHGDMLAGTVSVAYTPTQTGMARIVTFTMPHASRVSTDGMRRYSACIMDDQLVEPKDPGSTMAGGSHSCMGSHDMPAMQIGSNKVNEIDLTAMPKVGTVDVAQQAAGIAFWKMST